MLDAAEAVLLLMLPWSFGAKSLSLGAMWWELRFHTVPSGPLGRRINTEFRDQFVMSIFITAAMVILSQTVEASEIEWPYVSLVLTGLALFPFKAAWSHFQVFRTYRRIARDMAIERAESGRGRSPVRKFPKSSTGQIVAMVGVFIISYLVTMAVLNTWVFP